MTTRSQIAAATQFSKSPALPQHKCNKTGHASGQFQQVKKLAQSAPGNTKPMFPPSPSPVQKIEAANVGNISASNYGVQGQLKQITSLLNKVMGMLGYNQTDHAANPGQHMGKSLNAKPSGGAYHAPAKPHDAKPFSQPQQAQSPHKAGSGNPQIAQILKQIVQLLQQVVNMLGKGRPVATAKMG